MSEPEQEREAGYEGTARLGNALKGRLARRAIDSAREGVEEDPFTAGQLLQLDQLELRMENRRELDELRELTRDA